MQTPKQPDWTWKFCPVDVPSKKSPVEVPLLQATKSRRRSLLKKTQGSSLKRSRWGSSAEFLQNSLEKFPLEKKLRKVQYVPYSYCIPTPEGAAALGSWKPLTVQLETIKPWNSGTLEARNTVNLETLTLKHRKSCLRTVWNLFFWSHAPPHPLRPKVIEIPSSRWRINPTLSRNPDLGLDLFTLGALIEGIEY